MARLDKSWKVMFPSKKQRELTNKERKCITTLATELHACFVQRRGEPQDAYDMIARILVEDGLIKERHG